MVDAVLGVPRLVGLDTMVFVYAFERHAIFGPPCERILRAIEAGRIQAVMSSLVLGELLVKPFQDNRPSIARSYIETLARLEHLQQVPADGPVCVLAAELRAGTNLRLPDAIHVATASVRGAAALITGDARLPATRGLAILRPDEMAANLG